MAEKRVLIKASVDPDMFEWLDARFRANPEFKNITYAIREALRAGRRALDPASLPDDTPPA